MNKIEIAKIVKSQGIKGDVKVIVFADDDFDFASLKNVYIEDKLCNVEKVYKVGGGFAIKLDCINSRNEADTYKDKYIYIDRSQIKQKQGRYLQIDLIGKIAQLDNGKIVGKITDIQNFGSADVFFIKGEQNVLCSHKIGLIKEVNDIVIFDSEIFAQVSVYEN